MVFFDCFLFDCSHMMYLTFLFLVIFFVLPADIINMSETFNEALNVAQQELIRLSLEYSAGSAEELYFYVCIDKSSGTVFWQQLFVVGGALYRKGGLPNVDKSISSQYMLNIEGLRTLYGFVDTVERLGSPMPTALKVYHVPTADLTERNVLYSHLGKGYGELADSWYDTVLAERV